MEYNRVHLKAPGNWLNDPNGFIYYGGKYHLFYQYFPYGTRWGRMHWGHAVSGDLVNWKHEKVALFPSKRDDRDGCFSGSAVEDGGKLYLFYTGVRYLEENPEDTNLCLDDRFVSAQMMISSKDGRVFDNIGDKRVIIPVLEDGSLGSSTHARDPKVWRGTDAWYLVLGTCMEDGNGKLLFYRSEDLYQWTYVNSVSKEGYGWMWECPDLFSVNGVSVLSFSPMGFFKDGRGEENQNVCMIVEFDEKTCSLKMTDEFQFLDYGLDLYAAQSTTDARGRRVMVAWARMPEAVEDEWIGMISLPRVVEVLEGHIYFRVHPDVRRAFCRPIEALTQASEAGYYLAYDLEDEEEIAIGGYRIWRKGNKVCTDRSAVAGEYKDGRMAFETPELKNGCHLDIFVDPHLVEVFVNDGEYVISNVVYGLSSEIQAKKSVELYTVEEP